MTTAVGPCGGAEQPEQLRQRLLPRRRPHQLHAGGHDGQPRLGAGRLPARPLALRGQRHPGARPAGQDGAGAGRAHVPRPGEPADPHFDGGTTKGFVPVQFFISPGAQQTTTTNPQNPVRPDLPDFVHEFYDKYQKKLTRCIWKLFSSDAYGNPTNGAAVGSGDRRLRSVPIRLPIKGLATAEDWDVGARLEECIFGNMRP